MYVGIAPDWKLYGLRRIPFQRTRPTADNGSVREPLLVFSVMKMVNVIVNAETIRKFLYSSRPTEQFLMEVIISLIGNFRYVFKLFKKLNVFYLCIIVVHIVNLAGFIKICSLKGSTNTKFSVI